MSLTARIDTRNYQRIQDGSGSVITTADTYVNVYDENGNLTDANNGIVTIRTSYLNNAFHDEFFTVTGSSRKYQSGMISRFDATGQPVEMITYSIVKDISSDQPSLPVISNVHIESITINQKESAPGAADGQITINALSDGGTIMYSLDNAGFQTSSTFSNLAGGGYTAYVNNANGDTASYTFNLDTLQNLLISDPSVDLGGGNISRWSAAFNPIVFTYQRKDISVISISNSSITSGTQFLVNADTSAIKKDDQVYINAGAYKGVYTVATALTNGFVIPNPFVAGNSATGFINSNTMRNYYKVVTNITYQDKFNGTSKTVQSINRPDNSGLVRADLSSFLQSLLRATDESDYTQINYRDDNLSASYQISYQEVWGDTDPNKQNKWININSPYYITYSAKQLGDLHGGNMAAYVPFKTVSNPNQRAKWVTDFTEPAYSIGYPFDIGFIYSEGLLGLDIYYELIMLDANRRPLSGTPGNVYLLNDDGSYLLNQDSGRFIISKYGATQHLSPNQLGLNRLMIDADFPREACYFTLTLKYKDDANNEHVVTQTQTVRIDDAVDDQSVYLRWIGLSGAWQYYRFVFNQEVSLDVQNAVIVKNFVSDWEKQQGIEEVINKSAGQKMKVMAEDLAVADIKGLQSIKYSPKVQMLINRNPVKWQTVVLNTATFTEYETRYGQYAFSVTFNLPSINIQTQ